MTDVDGLLKKYEGLIRATTIKYTRAFKQARHIGNLDDHVAEANIAAWRAIQTFQSDKQTKLETYMIGCIRNRMIDINRKACRQSRPELTFESGVADHDDHVRRVEPIAEDLSQVVEDRLSFERILDEEEYQTLVHFLDGGGTEQLVVSRCRKTSGEKVVVRMEIVACLHRIRHKLESSGVSLTV